MPCKYLMKCAVILRTAQGQHLIAVLSHFHCSPLHLAVGYLLDWKIHHCVSLLPECHRWSERALHALYAESHGGREEMQLQACLGQSLMFTRGHSDAARAALNNSLAIAEARADLLNEVRLAAAAGPVFLAMSLLPECHRWSFAWRRF